MIKYYMKDGVNYLNMTPNNERYTLLCKASSKKIPMFHTSMYFNVHGLFIRSNINAKKQNREPYVNSKHAFSVSAVI